MFFRIIQVIKDNLFSIFSILALLLITSGVIWDARQKRKQKLVAWKETVKQKSTAYRAVLQYNQKWLFEIRRVTYTKEFLSRREAENASESHLLQMAIDNQQKELVVCVRDHKNKLKLYEQYLAGLRNLPQATSYDVIKNSGIPEKLFLRTEKELLAEAAIKPLKNCILVIRRSYLDENHTVHYLPEFKIDSDRVEKEITSRWKNTVRATSTKRRDIVRINEAYRQRFHSVQPTFHYTKSCNTLSEFKKYLWDKTALEDVIIRQRSVLETAIRNAEQNRTLYSRYLSEIAQVRQTQRKIIEEARIPEEFYINYENHLAESEKLSAPQTEIRVTIALTYTSPKGKSTQNEVLAYSLREVKDAISSLDSKQAKQDERRSEKEVERNKMTNSLRYDVMKRDRFRCVLCGASAKDGVQLHVDHILPVAKGGKTELSNLRTLCSRCNSGKRDKYDAYGPN